MIENSIHLQVKNKSQSPLDFQNLVAKILFLPLYFSVYFWMRWIKGYRIENLNSIRMDFEKYLTEDNRPILICANHLTLINSMLIAWGLGRAKTYVQNFRFFGWNLPKKDNFYHSYWLRTLCYLAKCVTLWLNWAAKESAFKVLNKLIGNISFSHKKFEFENETNRIKYKEYYLKCHFICENDFVHCYCISDHSKGTNFSIKRSVNEIQHSKDVRTIALSLIHKHIRIGSNIIIKQSSEINNASNFPVFYDRLNGQPLKGVDLSLSHDGNWIAAAITINKDLADEITTFCPLD